MLIFCSKLCAFSECSCIFDSVIGGWWRAQSGVPEPKSSICTDMCQTGNSYENGNGNPEPDSARDPQKTKSAPALNLLHTLDVIVQNCMNEAFVK